MAHTAEKNTVFFQRMQNTAIALQNLREEIARLKMQFETEISPDGQGDSEFFVDVSGIATKADVNSLRDTHAQIENVFSNVQVSAGYRGHILVPFLTNDPQL